jgi:CBS domain-containing protein
MEPIGSLLKDRPLFTISSGKTVHETAMTMAEKNVGALPVVEGERLVGLFSERDVITRVIAKGLNPASTLLQDVMTKNLVVATAEEDISACLVKMQQAHCRHLPVVSGERLVGFISLRDLLQKDLSQKTEDLEYLKNYMFTIPPGSQK